MLIGSVSEEGNRMSSKPPKRSGMRASPRSMARRRQPESSPALKKNYPNKQSRPCPTCAADPGLNGLSMRNNVVKMSKLKHDLNAAPAYAYYFTWQTPILDGLPGAWHTADLQFCFDNTKRCEQGTGNTPEAQALAKKMSTAWANFARTGNPSQPGLTWAPSDPSRNQTMNFDNQCRMVDDPDGDVRKILLG